METTPIPCEEAERNLAAYQRLGHHPQQFPNAHGDQGRILSLPMFAEITPDQQRTVIDLVREFD